jgi:hypothetical protein
VVVFEAVERSCEIGALLCGGSVEDLDSIYRFQVQALDMTAFMRYGIQLLLQCHLHMFRGIDLGRIFLL